MGLRELQVGRIRRSLRTRMRSLWRTRMQTRWEWGGEGGGLAREGGGEAWMQTR